MIVSVRKVTNYVTDKLTLTPLYFNWLDLSEDQLQLSQTISWIYLSVLTSPGSPDILANLIIFYYIIAHICFIFYYFKVFFDREVRILIPGKFKILK